VDAVTIQDVSLVAKELLPRARRTLAVIGPFAEEDFDSWPAAS
jgi:predicted Zn-dependent peptidase